MFTFADSYGSGMGDVLFLDGKLYLLMTNENVNIPRNETHTWLEPGAWRKPCIVHVTMVANSRQALFGKLSHNGSEAVIEKTPIGWALINQQRRLLELCPEVKILADKVMPDHHHMVLHVQRTPCDGRLRLSTIVTVPFLWNRSGTDS